MGRLGEGFIALVFLFDLRNGDGGAQSQLSLWRRRSARGNVSFSGREDGLIVAALLHDIGHLLHHAGEDAAEVGVDTQHEELGQRMLSSHLPHAVTEPIRLHVAAKRYLCFADPAYAQALSPSSQLSLQLQGGPMSVQDAQEFLAGPFARQAVALRLWDDEAKVPDFPVPLLEDYIPQLSTLWR